MAASKKTPDIKSLYYITHRENVPSILKEGILSHQYVEDHHVKYTPIYDASIVSNRKLKSTPTGQSLWEYANVYFQARNPMLYRVLNEKRPKDIVVIGVQRKVLMCPGVYVTDGNAANAPTEFYDLKDGLRAVFANWKTITSEWWNSVDGSKRKIMAECLVPNRISPDLIHSIYVADHETAARVRSAILPSTIPVVPEPTIFFRPTKTYPITPLLSLAEGDMFFSKTQTLTVSVNTVGIMGKGLASRAKYQFPDVYVFYQDACRQKQLKMGRPYLYKRESSYDEELIDEPRSLANGSNDVKWFLLFPTKRHWRDNSDLKGIEEGLRWLADNYKGEGISSIALPALGCGLGNLEWKDVGPVMCRHLRKVEIRVFIYLPREKAIAPEYLSPRYLLREPA